MKIEKKIASIALWSVFTVSLFGQVRVYRESVTFPSYGVREPEIMPDWRTYHYPYTMMDRLTNEKGTRTYNGLYIENEYVKALVLPELGGRLHGAQDKTNGYQFLYDQKVIKPGLVSLTGAWISGGIEWNFPIGHRPSGFRDTDWTITENQDGSKTAWVGEIEKLKGMRWSVGTTVHPGRNWVETRVRLENCTPFIQSFQYWATSAVRATPEYQAVIPGEIMTGHGKQEFFHWPVDKGVDISYWKNTPGASSYFAVESASDYFGGYSPEEHAGMVHVADHHIVRGKKLWTWGTAPAGRLWEKILTDGDLPYFEPQAGAYSDNQPSLFWIMPGETKIFSHFWFPVREIGVFDFANLEGSINLELIQGKALFGWSPTGMNHDARIEVYYDGEEIFRKITDADPAKPFIGEVTGSGMSDLYKLKMIVLSSAGDTLLAYSHPIPEKPSLPEAELAPPEPGAVTSQDLLFIYGDRFYRFDEAETALPYFREALRRDPGDIRSNAAMGEMALKNGLYDQALEYFNRSLERDETYFKAWYYKGLTQIRMGDLKEAENCLTRASYGLEWYAIASFELAQLAASQNRLNAALEYIQQSIRGNGDNSQAHALEALILLDLGRSDEATAVLLNNQISDPLDLFSKRLQWKAAMASGEDQVKVEGLKKQFLELSRTDPDNHIEMAIRFARCGHYQDAIQVLELAEGKAVHAGTSPLVFYYQAYYHALTGNPGKAHTLLTEASGANPKYCFPFRLETFPVMEWALLQDPGDAPAHYLLGNLLKKCGRLEEATVQWENSVVLDSSNAVAFRNLGLVYFEQGNLHKAKGAYEAAIRADPGAGMAIIELGTINQELGLSVEEQIGLYESHLEVVKTYNPAVYQLVELYIQAGRNQDALNLLNHTHFNSWEGRYGIHQLWVQANVKQGDAEFDSGNLEKALWFYQQSLLYPDNLEVAEQPNTIHARKKYMIGKTLVAMGKKREARKYFEAVIADRIEPGNAYQYFRGRAMEATGQAKEAQLVFENMLDAQGDKWRERGPMGEDHLKEQSVWWYERGLALDGLGKGKEAENCFHHALGLNPMVELSAFSPPGAGF
ncbi:MAG: DUF5107 domain-containing protein [Bacteroidota bacterium]